MLELLTLVPLPHDFIQANIEKNVSECIDIGFEYIRFTKDLAYNLQS